MHRPDWVTGALQLFTPCASVYGDMLESGKYSGVLRVIESDTVFVWDQ